ncbi:MAG: hypothetical protein LLF90_09225 [Methanomicrobiaceae archaeon]|uniref:hypothetical protein n=1 Tax=Methanoculleus sp. TaxID=90427 RepID=UPI00320EDAD4|nr:hypothetical protein [Methanomicrobiaceae archaeon]
MLDRVTSGTVRFISPYRSRIAFAFRPFVPACSSTAWRKNAIQPFQSPSRETASSLSCP